MNIKKILTLSFICVFFLSSSFIGTCLASGIIICPASFEYPIATKEITYEDTIHITNTGKEVESFVLVPEAAGSEWITFYNEGDLIESSFEIEAGESKEIDIKILIPSDTSNGKYEPIVYVMPEAAYFEAENNGTSISHGIVKIPMKFYITVTGDQILQGEVLKLEMGKTEENAPIKVKTYFKNTGNVQATPEMSCVILKDGNTISEVKGTGDIVKPGKEEEVIIMASAEVPEGEYQVEITISLGNEVLKTEILDLKVLPEGSLAKEASLIDLDIEGETAKESLLKVLATVENTGEADLTCKYVGEVYVDGALVDVIESEEMFFPVGKTKDISIYYKPTDIGKYEIHGKVTYSGQETEEKTVSFSTGKTTPGFGIIIAITSIMLLFLIRKK